MKKSYSEILNKKFLEFHKKIDDPDFLRFKETEVNSAFISAISIFNSEGMKRIYSTAREILGIVDKTKQASIPSVIAASIASAETITKLIKFERITQVSKFIESQDFYVLSSSQEKLIKAPFVLNNSPKINYFTEISDAESKDIIDKYEIGQGNHVFIHRKKDLIDNVDRIKNTYVNKEFDITSAYQTIWSYLDNKAFLIKTAAGLEIMPLKQDISYFVGHEETISLLEREIPYFRNQNISRSFLFVGPPGTGKTSLAHVVCEAVSPKILKIDPSILGSLNTGDLEDFIESIKPDAVILDDIDSACKNGASSYLLFLLESLKKHFPQITVFACANDWYGITDAIKRPGRFDRVLWIENPSFGERIKILGHLTKTHGVELDHHLFMLAAEGTSGFSQAYLNEFVLRLKSAYDHELTIKETLVEFRKTLNIHSKNPLILTSLPDTQTEMPTKLQEEYFDVDLNPFIEESKDEKYSVYRFFDYN